jgi:hypothetical protein
MRTAGVNMVSLGSGELSMDLDSHKKAVRELRKIVQECGVPQDGNDITNDPNVSTAELYMLAEMDIELRGVLANADKLTKSQAASLLIQTAANRDVATLKMVVNSGVPANLHDEVGDTAIMGAVGSLTDSDGKICYLAALGVDPFSQNNAGFSAIDKAVMVGDERSLLALLKVADAKDPLPVGQVQSALGIAEQLNSPLVEELADWLKSSHIPISPCSN